MPEIKNYSQWSADNALDKDPIDALREYTDYARMQYLRSGVPMNTVEPELRAGIEDKLKADGLLSEETTPEQLNELQTRLFAPKANLDFDAAVVQNYLALDDPDSGDEETKNNSSLLRDYLAKKKYSAELAAPLEGAVKDLLQDGALVRRARVAAVDRGEYNAIAVTEDDGTRNVYAGSRDLEDSEIPMVAESLVRSGALDTSDIVGLQDNYRKVFGGKSTLNQNARSAMFNDALDSLSKTDPEIADILSGASAAAAKQESLSREGFVGKAAAFATGSLAAPFVGLGEAVGAAMGLEQPKPTGAEIAEYQFRQGDSTAAEMIRQKLLENPAMRKRFSEQEISAFTNDRVLSQTDYKFDNTKPESGLRQLSTGEVNIAPALLASPQKLEDALGKAPLNEEQKEFARKQRAALLDVRVPQMLKLIASSSDEAVSAYATAKQNGVGDREFVEQWLSNEGNYSSFGNRAASFGLSALRAIGEVPLGIAALAGSETATNIMLRSQAKQSRYAEYGALFGDEFGLAQEALNTLPAVAVDIALTIGTAGVGRAASAAARAGSMSARTLAKGAVGVLDDAALAAVRGASAGAAAETSAALQAAGRSWISKAATTAVEQTIPVALPAFTRSASSTYVSIYGSLPEDMTHEEKHKQAIGFALAAGVGTAAITAGLSALGAGGVEKLGVRTAAKGLDDLTYREAKVLFESVKNEGKAVSDKAFRGALAAEVGGNYKRLIGSTAAGFRDEAFEEALDQSINMAIEDAALKKNRPLAEKLQQVWNAGLIGGVLGGGLNLASQALAPTASAQTKALQQRTAVLDGIAKRLSTSNAPETAASVQRMMDAANAAAVASTKKDTAAAAAQTAAAPTTAVRTVAEQLEFKFDDPRGVPPADTRLADLIGERVYIGDTGINGIAEIDTNTGEVVINFSKPTKVKGKPNVTRYVLGTKFQKATGVTLKPKIKTLTKPVGGLPAGTRIFNTNKLDFVLPSLEAVNKARTAGKPLLVLQRDEKQRVIGVTLRGVALVKSPTTTTDTTITDPDLMREVLRFYPAPAAPTGGFQLESGEQLELDFNAPPEPELQALLEDTDQLEIDFEAEAPENTKTNLNALSVILAGDPVLNFLRAADPKREGFAASVQQISDGEWSAAGDALDAAYDFIADLGDSEPLLTKAALDTLGPILFKYDTGTTIRKRAAAKSARRDQGKTAPSPAPTAATEAPAPVTPARGTNNAAAQLQGKGKEVDDLVESILRSGADIYFVRTDKEAENIIGGGSRFSVEGATAAAVDRVDGSRLILLTPSAFERGTPDLIKTLAHERIHLVQYAFEDTPQGKIAADKAIEAFNPTNPAFDRILDKYMRAEYPGYAELSPESKLREATRAIIESLLNGETSGNFRRGGNFAEWLTNLLNHIRRVLVRDSVVTPYVDQLFESYKKTAVGDLTTNEKALRPKGKRSAASASDAGKVPMLESIEGPVEVWSAGGFGLGRTERIEVTTDAQGNKTWALSSILDKIGDPPSAEGAGGIRAAMGAADPEFIKENPDWDPDADEAAPKKAAPTPAPAPAPKAAADPDTAARKAALEKLLPMVSTIEGSSWGVAAGDSPFKPQRPFVLVKVGSVTLPFYRSSLGTSGKKEGGWTPFFGMGKNTRGGPWMIKGSKQDTETGYGNPRIKEVQDLLNTATEGRDDVWSEELLKLNLGDGAGNLDESSVSKLLFGKEQFEDVTEKSPTAKHLTEALRKALEKPSVAPTTKPAAKKAARKAAKAEPAAEAGMQDLTDAERTEIDAFFASIQTRMNKGQILGGYSGILKEVTPAREIRKRLAAKGYKEADTPAAWVAARGFPDPNSLRDIEKLLALRDWAFSGGKPAPETAPAVTPEETTYSVEELEDWLNEEGNAESLVGVTLRDKRGEPVKIEKVTIDEEGEPRFELDDFESTVVPLTVEQLVREIDPKSFTRYLEAGAVEAEAAATEPTGKPKLVSKNKNETTYRYGRWLITTTKKSESTFAGGLRKTTNWTVWNAIDMVTNDPNDMREGTGGIVAAQKELDKVVSPTPAAAAAEPEPVAEPAPAPKPKSSSSFYGKSYGEWSDESVRQKAKLSEVQKVAMQGIQHLNSRTGDRSLSTSKRYKASDMGLGELSYDTNRSEGNLLALRKAQELGLIRDLSTNAKTFYLTGRQFLGMPTGPLPFDVFPEAFTTDQQAGTLSMLAPKGDNILYMLAGQSANIPQFMRDSLETAKAMAAAGKTREEIRAATGWFPGDYDGKMRWEIPDNQATVVPTEEFNQRATAAYGGPVFTTLSLKSALDRIRAGTVLRLGDVLKHDALFSAYPALANLPFFPIGGNISSGSFRVLDGEPMMTATVTMSDGRVSDETLSTILHEVQHWIQKEEGFARGGSTNNLITQSDLADANKFREARITLLRYEKSLQRYVDSLAEEQAKKRGFLGRGGPDAKRVASLESSISEVQKSVNEIWVAQKIALNIDKGSTRASLLSAINAVDVELGSSWVVSNRNKGLDMLYRLLAGEIEARDVQSRRTMTAEQRAATKPYSSENIAPDQAIVMFGTGDQSSILAPQGDNTLRQNIADIPAALQGMLPAGFTLQADPNMDGALGYNAVTDPTVVRYNPNLVGSFTIGLARADALATLRTAVDHELGHAAAEAVFTPADYQALADELGTEKLAEIVDRYYSGNEPDFEKRAAKIAADRARGAMPDWKIAAEWVRMEVERIANGRTSEQRMLFLRSRPSLLAKFIDALDAFVTRLRARFFEQPTTGTAASISNAARQLRKLRNGGYLPAAPKADLNYGGHAAELIGAIERGSDQTLFTMPIGAATAAGRAQVEGLWTRIGKKFQNLPPEFRPLMEEQSGIFTDATDKSVAYQKSYGRLLKKYPSASLDDIGLVLGRTDPTLDDAALARIQTELDAFAGTLPADMEYDDAEELITKKRDEVSQRERIASNTAFGAEQAAAEQRLRNDGHGEIADLVKRFRGYIDSMTKKYPELSVVIAENEGVYLMRTYRFFHTEGWALLAGGGIQPDGTQLGMFRDKEIDFGKLRANAAKTYEQDVIAEAAKEGVVLTAEQLRDKVFAKLDAYLEYMQKGVESEPSPSGGTLKKDMNRLLPKGNINKAILDLLGVAEDPLENAIRTMNAVGKLAAKQTFMRGAREMMLNSGLASTKQTPTNSVLALGKVGDPSVSPLGELWTTPELAQALQAEFGANGRGAEKSTDSLMREVGRVMTKAASVATTTKTLGSIGFYPRNIVSGQVLLLGAQGILPVNSNTTEAWSLATRAYFESWSRTNEQAAAISRMIELQVLKDDTQGRVAMDLMRGLVTNSEQDLDSVLNEFQEAASGNPKKLMDRLKQGVGKGYGTTVEFLAALNNIADGAVKAQAYMFELDVLKKDNASKLAADPLLLGKLEERAADKVKSTFPSHSRQYNWVKSLNQTSVGMVFFPFARWKTEVFRTMYNTPRLAIKEIREGGPAERVRGFRRMFGFLSTMAVGGKTLGIVYSAIFSALSDDEDKAGQQDRKLTDGELYALREALPDWQRSHAIYTRLIGGEVQVIDLTAMTPYAQLTDIFSIAIEGLKSDEGVNAKRIASYVATQLIGTQIAANAAGEVLNNRDDFGQTIYNETDNLAEVFYKSFAHYGKGALKPGAYDFYQRATRSGEQNKFEIVLGELLGARPRSHKLSEIEYRALRGVKKMLDDSAQIKSSLVTGRKLDEEEVVDTLLEHQDALNRTQRKLAKTLEGLKSMGSTRGTLFGSAKAVGFSAQRMELAEQGKNLRWVGNQEWLKGVYQNMKRTGEDDPMNRINLLRRTLSGMPVTYDVLE